MKKLLVGVSLMFTTASYADTETINWYVDGNTYTTTTCQSGGDITLQTAPAKRGYTFTGWQVALYDFSTLDVSINGISNVASEANRTWTTTFSYGWLSGVSLCSVTSGNFAVKGIPDETTTGDEAKYCWCKATGYRPSDSNIVYENTSSSAWVCAGDRGTASACGSVCATYCSADLQSYDIFRRAIFRLTQ